MSSTQKPVAIVTGASSGIGLRITLALIKHGYDVVGTARTISKSKELKASADLVLVDGDISKKETAVKVAEAAIKHFGRIDLLVNNAGIFTSLSNFSAPRRDTSASCTVCTARLSAHRSWSRPYLRSNRLSLRRKRKPMSKRTETEIARRLNISYPNSRPFRPRRIIRLAGGTLEALVRMGRMIKGRPTL